MKLESSKSIEAQATWLFELSAGRTKLKVDGLQTVGDYDPTERPPEEVAIVEKARSYGAHAVFFEASRNGRAAVAQAFIFLKQDHSNDTEFAELHKRLWSWGGVPLIYRAGTGYVDLFRCAHEPDFISEDGTPICNPIKTLAIGSDIASDDAWWDASRLRNGTLWDEPIVCKILLSAKKSAHRKLVEEVRDLSGLLERTELLNHTLRRRLLILSLLIAYLEERGVLKKRDFASALSGAEHFFEILGNGPALVNLLTALEERFNGHVFSLAEVDRKVLSESTELTHYARLIEGYEDSSGQLNLWRLYSFRDLPVELISNIYQLFVADSATAVYTPSSLVKLMLEETLSWERLDQLVASDEVILDPACGSGVFLVEAYKRLVLHWRSRNGWKRPGVRKLRSLLQKTHGIDLEQGAVELAAFSLCLALCDALEPEEIRASVKLFPVLDGVTLHKSCFFDAAKNKTISVPVGVVVGNPPFSSSMTTEGARQSYKTYNKDHSDLPDKQLAYLFLHVAMDLLAPGGILAMIEPCGLLYNMNSSNFRRDFFNQWDVREVLDFVSVRGLFKNGNADPKVVVIVAEASEPDNSRKLLHAIFRRSGRALAEQSLDVDYYDLHWVERSNGKDNFVWRSNLLGGDRVYSFVSRLMEYPDLRHFAEGRNWDFGTGFSAGSQSTKQSTDHLRGLSFLPTKALNAKGIDRNEIIPIPDLNIERPRTRERFEAPLLLIKMHEELPRQLWTESNISYKNEIVGLSAPASDLSTLRKVDQWFSDESTVLQAFVAAASARLFTQRATAVLSADILSIPFIEDGDLELSSNERIVASDIVQYQRNFIRRGTESELMKPAKSIHFDEFDRVLTEQLGKVYSKKPLQILEPQAWPGIVCRAYSFGSGQVDWSGSDELRGKLDSLLYEQSNSSLSITRIARIYDDNFLFLLKPDRHRFWTKSIALRDADDILSDLRVQGF